MWCKLQGSGRWRHDGGMSRCKSWDGDGWAWPQILQSSTTLELLTGIALYRSQAQQAVNPPHSAAPPVILPPVCFQALALASRSDRFLVCWSSAGKT